MMSAANFVDKIGDFAHVKAWFERIAAREAVQLGACNWRR